MSRASQYSHTFSVPTSTPPVAETTTTAPSAAYTPASASPVKSRYPGVSIKLSLASFHSATASARLMEYLRSISSAV